MRKSLFPPFPPAAPEPLPTPEKFQQGRSYVAYIPVPIGGSDDDDEEEYDEEDYDDEEYYDEEEEYEYYYDEDDDDDDDYYDDEDVGVRRVEAQPRAVS